MFSYNNNGLFLNNQNAELFDVIFRQYSKPLFYYAAKFVDDDAARDIVQDVFIKLWTTENITVKLSFNGLLFVMVRNRCLQHIEKQKVRKKYLESSKLLLQDEELSFYKEDRTSLIELEMENKLNEVLNELPQRCRQVFMMSRYENKKNKQIAADLDISIKAVEKHITKALSLIRVEMKEYLPLLILLFPDLF